MKLVEEIDDIQMEFDVRDKALTLKCNDLQIEITSFNEFTTFLNSCVEAANPSPPSIFEGFFTPPKPRGEAK